MLFNGAIETTYLPRYITRVGSYARWTSMAADAKVDLALMIMRILIHVAAAFALIIYAERLLSWLVKDSVRETAAAPETPPKC